MKKLLVVLFVLCFAAPAMAVDWNFYGNARMETFYTSTDPEDVGDKKTDLRWDFQGNSRIGANVKADHIKGQFELGMGTDPVDVTRSGATDTGRSDGGDGYVTARRLYAVWNFGAGALKVGKDYSPITHFVSSQAFDTDLGLLGYGAPYGGRPGQVALTFGGFDVALITTKTNTSLIDPVSGANARDSGNQQTIIPKLEASYGMSFDAWNFKVMGGYQYYSLKNVESIVNPGDTNDIEVTSYIIAGGGTFNFGPAYVGAQAQYGQNMGDARWLGGAFDQATWDGDDDTDDVTSYGGILVAGMKVSDMLSFELGGGYQVDDPKDAPNGFDEKTNQYSVYLNSTIAMAPGVFIIPEVGILSFGNNPEDEDQGNQFYLGAKWQINF
jgi:hypothetical protein